MSRDFPIGIRTDLLVAPSNSRLTELPDGAWLLRTSERDDYHFGNVLVLPSPPTLVDLGTVIERWRQAFADAAGVGKVVILWETEAEPPPVYDGLGTVAAKHGLDIERNVVLRLTHFAPKTARVPLQTRPLENDADWSAVLEVATADNASPGRKAFMAWRQDEYRRLVECGRGKWWMGELAGRAVTSAGIFWDNSGRLARFQSVDTLEAARNQGCCTGLLSAMLSDTLTRLPALADCIIVADAGAQGERIYRRLGFSPVSRLDALSGDRFALI